MMGYIMYSIIVYIYICVCIYRFHWEERGSNGDRGLMMVAIVYPLESI